MEKSKSKSKDKNKTRKIVAIVVALVMVVSIGSFTLWKNKSVMPSMAIETNESDQEVITTTAQINNISDTIVGTGNLTTAAAKDIDVLSDLTFSEVLVESGDTVTVGDVLAVVDKLSLMEMISNIQNDISNIDAQLETLKSEDEDNDDVNTIKSSVSGRVKKIYATEGTDVSSTIIEYGSLMLVSLDGKMAVDIESNELSVNDIVKVVLSDGSTIKTGTVGKVSNGVATITLSDNGADYEEIVTIKDSTGNILGTGSLYIHQPVSITANYGTVDEIEVDENDSIDVDDILITLSDTTYTLEYDKLLEERELLNEKLQKLLKISETYQITSEYSGTIENVNISTGESSNNSSSSSASGSNSISIAYAAKEENTVDISSNSTSITTSINEDGTYTIVECMVPLDLNSIDFDSTDYFDTTYLIEDGFITVTYTALDGYTFTDETKVTIDNSLVEVSDIHSTGDTLTYVVNIPLQDITHTEETSSSIINDNQADQNSEESSNEDINNLLQSMQDYSSSTDVSSIYNQNVSDMQSQSTDSLNDSASSISISSESDNEIISDLDSSSNSSTNSYTSSENSSLNTMTAFTINTNETMDISITIDELDILSVSKGQFVEITIDALEDETFQGIVTEISDTASSSGGVANYSVTISVPKNDSMKSGMSATATITVLEKDNILTIPMNALQEEGNKVFVYTEQDENGNLSGEVEIQTGLSTDDLVEITSGLSEGDTIYYYKNDSSANFSFDNNMDISNFGGDNMPNMGGGQNGGFPGMN